MNNSRRTFLKLFGKATVSTAVMPLFLESCGNNPNHISKEDKQAIIKDIIGIQATDKDDVILAEGLSYDVLISFKDNISEDDFFGFNNDFLCYIPLDKNNINDGLLWVNHEYAHALFVNGFIGDDHTQKSKEDVEKEKYVVGGSIVRIQKYDGKWSIVKNDPYNKRLNAFTEIPFNWEKPIANSGVAIGTHSNCSGGITPWNTILTCEENYDMYEGETIYNEDNEPTYKPAKYGWDVHYNYPPEHYGWVVEVDLKTGKAQKHVALGRFAHECCTLVRLEDGRIVAYSGDDKNNEFIYKFISSKPDSLKDGTLYVANTDKGKWISLNIDDQPLLQEKFKDQTEVLIRVREAAKLLGATPQNRPEDIEIDPINGNVIIALTNNYDKENFHGSILKIEENGTHDALDFTAEDLLVGGKNSGFTCPDNLAFDKQGNLWFTSDMSGSKMLKEDGPYFPEFKNNGLFLVPRTGAQKGQVIQVASAPRDAELTGPWFSNDYKTLFLSVQHPGENSSSLKELTSHWPQGGNSLPKPSVICISGPLLENICGV